MKFLVTGASGFIGSRLFSMLSEQGHHAVTCNRGDVPRAIINTVSPDVVIHLAGHYTFYHHALDAARLVESNIAYGVQVLEAMRQHGVRHLVTLGSMMQYRPGDASAVNLYAATKAAFQEIIDYFVAAYGFDAVTLMLSDTYGPGDTRGKLVQRLCEATGSSAPPLKMSPGHQTLNLVHVDDVCRAIIGSAQAISGSSDPPAHYKCDIVGDMITPLALADMITKACGRAPNCDWGALPYRYRESMVPPLGHPLPGFAPRIALEDGLKALFRN